MAGAVVVAGALIAAGALVAMGGASDAGIAAGRTDGALAAAAGG